MKCDSSPKMRFSLSKIRLSGSRSALGSVENLRRTVEQRKGSNDTYCGDSALPKQKKRIVKLRMSSSKAAINEKSIGMIAVGQIKSQKELP